jgi:hypothetical protein
MYIQIGHSASRHIAPKVVLGSLRPKADVIAAARYREYDLIGELTMRPVARGPEAGAHWLRTRTHQASRPSLRSDGRKRLCGPATRTWLLPSMLRSHDRGHRRARHALLLAAKRSDAPDSAAPAADR